MEGAAFPRADEARIEEEDVAHLMGGATGGLTAGRSCVEDGRSALRSDQRPFLMKSATRSPMTIVVTFVFARTQSGMIDASATRKHPMPRTFPN